ncbi:hypothetical protein FRC17_004187 [Serendipita sp. 399]|nr:hypothetical protein FRC17_004187 [Serendipita sp. 399]
MTIMPYSSLSSSRDRHHAHSEKFVTRKEYDEIKDSLTRLQSILSNNPSATTTTSAVPGGMGAGIGVGGMGGAAAGGVVDPLQVAQALSVVQSKFGNVVPGLGTSTTSMNMPPPPPPPPAHELKLRMNSAGGGTGGGVGGTTHTPSSSSPSPSLSYPLPLPASSSSNASSTPLLRGGSGTGTGVGAPFTLSVPSQSPQISSSSMMYPSNAATVPFGGVNVSVVQRYPTNANDEEGDDDTDEFLRRPYPPRASTSSGRDRASSSASGTHFVPHSSSSTRRRQGSLMGVPEIHLGGLVVENQSPVHPGVYTAHGQYQPQNHATHAFHHPHHPHHSQNGNKLDTLASVAHSTTSTASAMTNLGILEVPSSTSLPAASSASASSLTLAPIGGGSRVLFGGGSADVMASREVEMRRLLERSLPRKEVCDRLVSHYFDLVEWSLVLLHRPTFMYTYQAFWLLSEAERARLVLRAFTAPVVSTQSQQQQQPGGSATWGESFRASFVPPPTTTSTSNTPSANVNVPKVGGAGTGGGGYVVSSSWVALLFAVMCVALERMGFYDSKVIGINTVDEYQRQCRVLYDASQSVLVLGDIIRSRSLETVQTL